MITSQSIKFDLKGNNSLVLFSIKAIYNKLQGTRCSKNLQFYY